MLDLTAIQEQVNKSYVGFQPNSASVKPVHIYSGATRIIYGKSVNTQKIARLSYVSDAKGRTPTGNTLESVKKLLEEIGALDEGIRDGDLNTFRNLLQKLLNADSGVFDGTGSGMVSYSAGSKYFITSRSIYEDAGEFVGSLIKKYCPELFGHIRSVLEKGNDPISILFEPVATEDIKELASKRLDEIEIFKSPNEAFKAFTEGVSDAGNCLYKHLSGRPNLLAQLRIFNFFCIYVLVRYLASLESFYCGEREKSKERSHPFPFLLDFTGVASSSVARTSIMSYTQIHRAISRFYAWGYSQCLQKEGFTNAKLMKSEVPRYKKGKAKVDKGELARMWELAKAEACHLSEEKALLEFGKTMYDMLALEASSYPVVYLRQIGTLAGLLYPPTNFYVDKRFVVSQDMLEMIMCSCVEPGEALVASELKARLWSRFGIVIGGDEADMEKIQTTGGIISADIDALRENFKFFSKTLEAINFADVMADGILQIRLGGVSK